MPAWYSKYYMNIHICGKYKLELVNLTKKQGVCLGYTLCDIRAGSGGAGRYAYILSVLCICKKENIREAYPHMMGYHFLLFKD